MKKSQGSCNSPKKIIDQEDYDGKKNEFANQWEGFRKNLKVADIPEISMEAHEIDIGGQSSPD